MIFLCSPKQSSFVHGKKKSLRATAHLWAIGGCVWKWIWADSEPMSKPKMPIANANGRCGAQEMTQVWGNYRNEQGQTAEMLQITIWKRRNARLDACIHRCRCRAREIHMFVQPENVRHTQAFASIYWQPHTRRTSVCVWVWLQWYRLRHPIWILQPPWCNVKSHNNYQKICVPSVPLYITYTYTQTSHSSSFNRITIFNYRD